MEGEKVNQPGSETRPRDKKQTKAPFSNFAALAIGGFIVVTTLFLVFKGKTPKGTCQYEHSSGKVTCKVKQLEHIPLDIPHNALSIHMGSKYDKNENSLVVLERANFSDFKQLQELQLVKCGIRDIEPDTFADLTALKILDLRYNRINTVDESTFRGLTSIEVLYLSNNPITHLSDYTFRGIRIENLILANNPALSQLSSKAFAGAILRTLVLNRCSLTELPRDVFWNVGESLQELHLTNNIQPLILSDDAFKGLKFKVLNLDNNGIIEEDFLQQTTADEISLDDNPLGELDLEEAVNMQHTRRLSLGNTNQEKISPEDFANLVNLEELDLEKNELTTFNATDLSEMKNLKILDISSNKITNIAGSFENLPSLESMYVDNNDIYTLSEELETVLSKLQNFTIHGNPLHCNCELKWFAKWLQNNRGIVEDEESITCNTPVVSNFTQILDSGFHCRSPKILNATFDSDGISLVCTAEGDPAPVISWAAEDSSHSKTVNPVEYRKDILQTTCTLAISKYSNYTCLAANVAGSESVTIDTRTVAASGHRFLARSEEIEILETPQGFWITVMLICIFGYIMKKSR